MPDKIVYLHEQPTEIGQFLRVGTTGFHQLEGLLGAGRVRPDRVVFDASMVNRQEELRRSLVESGAELVLDTNIAELSSIGKFAGRAKEAPWANPNSVLSPDDMRRSPNRDLVGDIARFTVSKRFHSVLAPTHILSGSTDKLLRLDLETTADLRRALDAEGGKAIDIRYALNIPYGSLRDPAQRRALIALLANVDCSDFWIRISGFGSDATPMGVRRYIAAMMDFQRMGRPIVADFVGGLAGIAIVAFGAAGGICHGVGEKERFDAGSWNKQPKGGGGGQSKRVLVHNLDISLTYKELELLMSKQGGRKLLSCGDRSCCQNGYEDMVKNPKAHFLNQRSRQITEINRIPDHRRVSYFLENMLDAAERTSREAVKIDVGDQKLADKMKKTWIRLDGMKSVLRELGNTIADSPRALVPTRAMAKGNINSIRGFKP